MKYPPSIERILNVLFKVYLVSLLVLVLLYVFAYVSLRVARPVAEWLRTL